MVVSKETQDYIIWSCQQWNRGWFKEQQCEETPWASIPVSHFDTSKSLLKLCFVPWIFSLLIWAAYTNNLYAHETSICKFRSWGDFFFNYETCPDYIWKIQKWSNIFIMDSWKCDFRNWENLQFNLVMAEQG